MKSLSTIVILFAITFLVVAEDDYDSSAFPLNTGEDIIGTTVITATMTSTTKAQDNSTTAPATSMITSANSSAPVTTPSESSTSTNAPTTAAPSATTPTNTSPLTTSNVTTTTIVTEPSTTTTQKSPTTTASSVTDPTSTAAPGRKFDGLSFLGGMILTLGIGALAFLIARYVRRSTRMPYANLQ